MNKDQKRIEECPRLIADIIRSEFGECPLKIKELFQDVIALYRGDWPQYESCLVEYHGILHALEVTLATTRMMAGWNRDPLSLPKIEKDLFCIGIAAALFHDSGYIKDKGDTKGQGGKFTFSHVYRGMDIAKHYIEEKNWPAPAKKLVPALIEVTEFNEHISLGAPLSKQPEKSVACILATADILTQVSDPCYFERLPDLFSEFKEAYDFEGEKKLKASGYRVFDSLQELKNSAASFFDQVVVPRIEKLGRMDRYFKFFFESSEDPYQKGIFKNFQREI